MFKKRSLLTSLLASMLAFGLLAPSAWADDAAAPKADNGIRNQPKEASALEGAPTTEAAAPKEEPKSEAEQWYEQYEAAFMHARWAEFDELAKEKVRRMRELEREHRTNILYMDKTNREYRPSWWKNCRSTKAVSFKAMIWRKSFTANYDPSTSLGFQGIRPRFSYYGNIKGLDVIVSWRPSYVDNPKPLADEDIMNIYGLTPHRSKEFDFTLGTMAETIAWHELGHNYITISLKLQAVLTLFQEYEVLFRHMQEFYADMTALYHTSPKSRLFTMMFRLNELESYDESEAHARGCAHGCGSLLFHEMLRDPDKWPSVHWPAQVPDKNIEVETIKYVYSHIDPKWTLSEDRELRSFIDAWLRKNGQAAFENQGKWKLSSGQEFNVMATQDRRAQSERDLWVKTQLEKIIAAGKADDMKTYEEFKNRVVRRYVVEIRDGN